MKFTLGEIREMKNALIKISEQDLPIKISWRLLKLCERIDLESDKIEEFRIKLVEKYGTTLNEIQLKDKSIITVPEDEVNNIKNIEKVLGSKVEVKPENMNSFLHDFHELLSEEIDINYDPFDFELISDDIKMSTKELYTLKKLFIE